jgi:hypothetical protein
VVDRDTARPIAGHVPAGELSTGTFSLEEDEPRIVHH